MRKSIRILIIYLNNVLIYIRRIVYKKQKLLFYGMNPMNYTMFRPIKEEINRISDTEIYFCFKDIKKNYQEYIKMGVPKEKIISINRARFNIWDAIVMADFTKPRYLFPKRLIYICHGVAAKRWTYIDEFGKLVIDDYRYHRALKDFDLVFYHNETDYNNAKIRGLFKYENSGSIIGMCCLDEMVLNNNLEQNEIKKKKYVPKDYLKKEIILYAPTWDDTASFRRKGKEILETLSLKDAFVIVKPHPLCITGDVGDSGLDLPLFMKKLFPKNNYIIVTDTPYEVMTIADLMISDFGSISFEFTLLKKPIYLFEGNDITKIVADKEQLDTLKRCCYVFRENDTINEDLFISRILDDEKIYNMKLIKNTYFSNVGFATKQAVGKLLEHDVIHKR